MSMTHLIQEYFQTSDSVRSEVRGSLIQIMNDLWQQLARDDDYSNDSSAKLSQPMFSSIGFYPYTPDYSKLRSLLFTLFPIGHLTGNNTATILQRVVLYA